MNEMMYRKKLLNNLDALDDKIYSAFCSSDADDTIYMKNKTNTTLYEEICFLIKEWIEDKEEANDNDTKERL